MLGEIGFATGVFVSAFGWASIIGLAWTGGGVSTVVFGLVTRLVLAFGLDLVSNKNSTPSSGFSSAGGSGIATAFAFASGLILPTNPSFVADFALGVSWISSSGDLGAALAVAEVFLATAGFGGALGFISGTGAGAVAAAGFAFTARLVFAAALVFLAGEIFLAFAVAVVFFAVVFTGVFAGLAFKVFAPALARLRVVCRESGLAAVVFFGFFMATVLAMGGAFASGD